MKLDDILKNMDDELFEDNTQNNSSSVTEPLYQEEISPSVAKSLLKPEEFDPTCRYYMITEQDSTVILKYNDHAPITELNPDGIEQNEYVLESQDVVSYKSVRDSVANPQVSVFVGDQVVDTGNNRDKKFNIFILLTVLVFVLLVGVGVSILAYLLKI